MIASFASLLKLTLYFAASNDINYYSNYLIDGYSFVRYSMIALDLASMTMFSLVILLDPHFIASFRRFFKMKEV